MGTYSLKDAVTGQDIKEGEKMIGIFLSRDLSPESHKSKIGIFAESKNRYQMASLPIHGSWNGISLTPDKPNGFAAFTSHECIGNSSKSVEELMESMTRDSQRTYNGQNDCFGRRPDTVLEYSFLAIKASTLDVVKNITDIKEYYGAHDPDIGLQQMEALKVRFFEALSVYDEIDSRDKDLKIPAMYRCLKLSKSIFFQNANYEHNIENLPVPYAAKSMDESDNIFDRRMSEYFRQCGVGEFEGFEYLIKNRELPDYYPDMFKGLHEAQFIFDSMNFLDMPLQPTISLGGSYNSTAKLELMTGILQQEVGLYIDRCSENTDMLEVKKIDTVLGPIKACVAGLIRQRNDFEKEIKKFNNENN